jgi:hypothetical protein
MDPRMLIALATGVALAASCGLRAFLPLLAVGVAARLGILELRPGLTWLSGEPALWALGTATVLELAADKVPLLDHALDTIGTVLRPLSAWVASYAVLRGWPTPWAPLLALALGTGALAVHGAKAHARLGSTALTLGHANPLLSIVEDGMTLLLVVAAVLVPLAALVLAVAVLVLATRHRQRTRLVA